MTPEQEAALERAQNAYDEGRIEDALEDLVSLPPDDMTRCLLEFDISLQLGALDQARRCHATLERYERESGAIRLAQLSLAEWRIDAARTILAGLAGGPELTSEDAMVLEDLALCCELQGDMDEADRIYARVWELAPELAAPRFTQDQFDRVVTDAIRALPAEYRDVLETVEVIVDPVPSLELVQGGDLGETPPSILGLFTGASELERNPDYPEHPPRIFLFQRNLERSCRTREELIEQIETTFMHELGHLLGFDEDGVAALGLE